MKKIILFVIAALVLSSVEQINAQNVAINSSGAAAATSAMLDVSSTNSGVLIPRVALTATNTAGPITAPATSLMVYNTAIAGTSPNNVIPGYYYWDGAAWNRVATGNGSGWLTLGNAGTSAATNFIGTTDAIDWVVRTNNTERMRVLSAGNVGIGIAAATQRLDVQGGNARINNAFIGDVGHGAGWGGIAHSLQANTTGYAMISSGDGNFTLINKANTGAGYIGFRVGNLDHAVITNAGNMGIGTIAPGVKLDVYGGGGTTVDLRTTGRIWTYSTDGGIWLSNLQDCFMGNISATQCGFWTSSIGWNAFNITKSTGHIGVGTMTPSSRLHVVADADNLPVVYGVNVNTSAGTTSYGVRGECGSSGLGSAGISGVSTNSGNNEMGVLGDYSFWGAGVFGLGWAGAYGDMPASRDFGVFGTVNYTTGTGVYGRNTSGSGTAYGVYSFGNFAATGAKAASIPTTKGNQLVYCIESPEIWFEDIGSAKLVNGTATIALDALFMEAVLIDSEHPMQVFIQENGECNGVYVIKEKDKFIVKEKNGGHSNIEFTYRVMGKRRFYQDHRFGVDSNQDLGDNLSKAKYQEPLTSDPIKMRGILDKAVSDKVAQGNSGGKK